MTRRRLSVLTLVLAFASLAAGPPPKEDPDQKDLRKVLETVFEVFDKGDVDGLLKHVHPNVVATWQNGETVRGHEGLRKFYEKMMVGDGRTVRQMTSKLMVDRPALFYNDRSTAVSVGSMENRFDLKDGKSYGLKSRWTATLVKEKGKWQIAAFHIGSNVFDNGVLGAILNESRLWTGSGAAVMGLLLGALVSSMFRRKSAV